jgi:hypothetical protein
MILTQARAIVQAVLDPLPLTDFMAAVEASRALDVPGGAGHPRAMLFGEDPVRTVLDAHAVLTSRKNKAKTLKVGLGGSDWRCKLRMTRPICFVT